MGGHDRVDDKKMDFHSQLVAEILPFWARSVDREHGGFITEISQDGDRYGDGDKHIVMQGRMIYSFAVGNRVTGDASYLEHAAQGVEFLKRHFWDKQHGGWYRTTSRQGEPLDKTKFPYGIAFIILGLAEYARQSGDRSALDLAVQTYDLQREHAWDHARAGIYWNLNDDWSAADPTKRVDSMMHTMEGVSALLAATGDRRYLADLNELCDTIMTRTYDPENGCTHEWFSPDWVEMLDRTKGLINYGHIAEASWFISSVAAYTGNAEHLAFARKLLGYVLRQGWDQQHGGIFSTGKPTGGAVDTNKSWWMQAEMLGALSLDYRLTGDPLYLDWLAKQAEFVYARQRDAANGEWHSLVAADGAIVDGRKGSPWKAAYHVVQGVYHADRNLSFFRANGPTIAGASGNRWEEFAL
jgi:mannose/cellobiose epimerase-like protein (N-acyl-D-glucosamine 2-epimerase family)